MCFHWQSCTSSRRGIRLISSLKLQQTKYTTDNYGNEGRISVLNHCLSRSLSSLTLTPGSGLTFDTRTRRASNVRTNLPLMLHRFQVIGQIFASDRGVPHFNALARGDSMRIKINFTSPETRIVLPDTEDRMIVSSFFRAKHRNVTDGQTDRQTDGYALAITAVCIASNADAL